MKYFFSFSEAIRAGAELRPQAFGTYYREGKTCAWGAGSEAVFGDHFNNAADITSLYPYLRETCGCPECGVLASYESTIYHLNDDHRWKRKPIASWLEQEEGKLGFVTITVTEEARELEAVLV